MMSAGATVTDNTPYTFTYRMVEDRIVGLTNNVLKCAMSEVTSFAIHLVGVVASGYVEFGTEQHMMNVSDKNEKTTVINNLPEGAYAVNIGENGLATGLRGYLVPGNTPHNFDEITVIGVSSRLVNLGAANDITWKNSGSSYGYTVYGAFVPVATNDRNVLIIASNNGKYYAKYPAGNGPLR